VNDGAEGVSSTVESARLYRGTRLTDPALLLAPSFGDDDIAGVIVKRFSPTLQPVRRERF
jgi:hypothetical protein